MKVGHSTKWLTPSYSQFCELMSKMDLYAERLKNVNVLLEENYSHKLMLQYDSEKCLVVAEALEAILQYFPQFRLIPCAIYLNGSYARRSLTVGSDLDITFLIDEDFLQQTQGTILQVRMAIARVFNMNVVHIHSFSKNFINEFMKKASIKNISDGVAYLAWPYESKIYDILPGEEDDMTKREICEYLSTRSWTSFCNTMQSKMNMKCDEWMYSFEQVFRSVDCYDVEDFVRCQEKYLLKTKTYLLQALDNLSETEKMLESITQVVKGFDKADFIPLASFSLNLKKRIRTVISRLLIAYHRLEMSKGNDMGLLNIERYFEYSQKNSNEPLRSLFLELSSAFNRYRYIISRIEIAIQEKGLRVANRSIGGITRKNFVEEYNIRWKTEGDVFENLFECFYELSIGTKTVSQIFRSEMRTLLERGGDV